MPKDQPATRTKIEPVSLMEREQVLASLVEGFGLGMPYKKICSSRGFRKYGLTPEDVEKEAERLKISFPQWNPVNSYKNAWLVSDTLGFLLIVSSLAFTAFPHLPGLYFEHTLLNGFIFTLILWLSRWSIHLLLMAVLIANTAFTIKHKRSLGEQLKNKVGMLVWSHDIFANFILPSLGIVITATVCPATVKIINYLGPISVGITVWVCMRIFRQIEWSYFRK